MDFICYGFFRDALIYTITMIVALVPTYIAYKAFGVDKRKEVIEITPTFDSFSIGGVATFAIFMVCFFSGIYAANTLMDSACGFSPDYRGIEQEERIQDLQLQIEEKESEIRYHQDILDSLDD